MEVLDQREMQVRESPVEEQPMALSIENVLLATDFSMASEKAGAYAKALARHFGSRLEIANIFNPAVVTGYEEAIVTMTPAQMKEISDENLQRYARDLRLDGIDTRLICAEDHNASGALLQLANEHKADIIVCGTEAKGGLTRLILGSTAEHLVRWSACPVMTVGPRARVPQEGPLEFKTIIYATDLSPEATKAAAIAVAFAEDSAAHLYCCCVLSMNDEGLRKRSDLEAGFIGQMKKLVPEGAYDWCSPEFVLQYGEASESILKLADKVNADLIVLGARRASFWLTRVEGGLTPALLAHAKCPVLAIS